MSSTHSPEDGGPTPSHAATAIAERIMRHLKDCAPKAYESGVIAWARIIDEEFAGAYMAAEHIRDIMAEKEANGDDLELGSTSFKAVKSWANRAIIVLGPPRRKEAQP